MGRHALGRWNISEVHLFDWSGPVSAKVVPCLEYELLLVPKVSPQSLLQQYLSPSRLPTA